MTKSSLISLVACGLACLVGCGGEASGPRSPDAAAAGSAGSAGVPGAAGGSAQGGAAPNTNAGSSGQTSAGNSASGAPAGGASTAGSGGTSGGGNGGASNGGSGGAGGSTDLPPLEECKTQPSVDRFTQWIASGEGLTEPKTGTILLKEGTDYVASVHFVGAEWHVIPVYIANKFGDTADLSASKGLTLTYSATAELHVQLRSESHWSGGDQYATTLPSTNGQKETRFFSFAEANWKSLFGAPVLSYADTLKEGMGLVFVGNSENKVVFYGMRVDGWTPTCP